MLLANGALSVTVLAIYGGIVAFAHSNTRLSFGPLGRVLVSPNYHRIHHQLDGPQDVNLGFALTIWDQIFHRAVFPTAETVGIDTGLPGRPLIVEQATPRPQHLAVLAAQLVAPFRPMRDFPCPRPSNRSRTGPSKPRLPPRAAGHRRTASTSHWGRWRHGDGDGRDAPALGSGAVGDGGRDPGRAPALDWALLAVRIALAWIFIYYGAGKLFGSFNGPGIHRTALYFSQTAHLHPGGLFAVLGGVIEFGSGVALALGLFSRLAGVALFGDMVMAMITVTWATGINSVSDPPATS